MIDTILIPLIPVAVGAGLTLITSLILNKRNLISSLDEELAKERIEAHKSIYKLASELNHYMSPSHAGSIPKKCFLGYISTKDNEYHSLIGENEEVNAISKQSGSTFAKAFIDLVSSVK